MTNGDRIRKEIKGTSEMSNEKLARVLSKTPRCCNYCDYFEKINKCWEHDCHTGIIEWLKRKSRKRGGY